MFVVHVVLMVICVDMIAMAVWLDDGFDCDVDCHSYEKDK